MKKKLLAYIVAAILAVPLLAYATNIPLHSLSAGSAVSSTDTVPWCQVSSGCISSSSLIYETMSQIIAYIDGALGTVTSGTWAATSIAVAHGGTGATTGQAASTNLSVPYLAKQTNGVSLTGTEAEQIGAYYNVPANLLGSQGCVEVDDVLAVPGTNTGNAAITIRIITGTSAGTTGGTSMGTGTLTKGDTYHAGMDICNGNLSGGSTGAQFAFDNPPSPFAATSNGITTGAIDTTSAWTISVNCTTASATTDVCNFWRVRFTVRSSYGN